MLFEYIKLKYINYIVWEAYEKKIRTKYKSVKYR